MAEVDAVNIPPAWKVRLAPNSIRDFLLPRQKIVKIVNCFSMPGLLVVSNGISLVHMFTRNGLHLVRGIENITVYKTISKAPGSPVGWGFFAQACFM
jgi:hypothetical protein